MSKRMKMSDDERRAKDRARKAAKRAEKKADIFEAPRKMETEFAKRKGLDVADHLRKCGIAPLAEAIEAKVAALAEDPGEDGLEIMQDDVAAAEKKATINKAEATLKAAEEALVSARAELDNVNAKVRRCREAQKLALRTLRTLTGTAGPKRPATPAMVAHGRRSWEEPTEANGWTPGPLFRKFKLAAWLEAHPGETVADPSPTTTSAASSAKD